MRRIDVSGGDVVQDRAGWKGKRIERAYCEKDNGVRSIACVKRLGDILFPRASGLISPSRTTLTACNLAAKLKNLDRLTSPTGNKSTLTRAGATGDRESSPIITFGRISVIGCSPWGAHDCFQIWAGGV